ncbi:MAG: Ltp family lipoprotein [Actinomycetota bacterium]
MAVALLSACGGGSDADGGFFSSSGGSGGGGNYGVGGNYGGGGEEAGSDLTSGQENALSTAEDYISTSGFSRSGLIEQLEFEGYSTKNAAFAVDHLNLDWNEQAARSAEDYLSTSGFSRSGLIEQLEFDGYTRQQAEYGAGKALGGGGEEAASDLTSGQENALGTAEDYLSMSGFSRSALIEQLVYDGYTRKQAEYGADKAL